MMSGVISKAPAMLSSRVSTCVGYGRSAPVDGGNLVKWLVTGATGMLGTDLVDLLRSHGHEVTAAGRDTLDVTDEAAVSRGGRRPRRGRQRGRLDRRGRRRGRTRQQAQAVNGEAPRPLARAAREHGARLVQISTDYVFDGVGHARRTRRTPRRRPRSAYGRTKAERRGRRARGAARRAPDRPHRLVVRRPRRLLPQDHRPGRPRARRGERRGRPGRPAHLDRRRRRRSCWRWSRPTRPPGPTTPRRRAGAAGSTSRSAWWWPPAWSRPTVMPTTSDTFVRPAPRPAYSVLGHDALVRLGLEPIGDWESRWAEAATSVLA